MSIDPDTLERLVPDEVEAEDQAGSETLQLHVERYAFAATQAREGRLLDLACGVGYGTRLMADEQPLVREALGVDVSRDAIAHASSRYACERVHYRECDAMAFEDAEGFDTVVSLETIEHLPDPQRFFAQLVRLLRPGGVLVASVPTTPSVDLNPHHLHDFSERSFRRMGAGYDLEEVDAFRQVQPVDPLDVFRETRFKRENLRPNLVGYYASNPDALLRRIAATLRVGFANHYITIAWQRAE